MKAETITHSPAPWRHDPADGAIIIAGPLDRPVAIAEVFHVGGAEAANARLMRAAAELRQTVTDLCDILDDYFRYAAEMRKIGRGYSTVDTVGRVDVNVVFGARALLARIDGEEG